MPNGRTERIKKLLADLIGFNTVSDRSNLELIAYIETYLTSFGISGHRIPSEDGHKSSLWVTIGPADEPGMVLSGHTDVVPVAGQNWTSNPFEMVERDGKLYGRGTADMKGFVAVCLAMVPEIQRANLKMPIHLAFSYDEEVGCIGVRPMLKEISRAPVKPVACFVGEPTEMQVMIGHKGKRGISATFRGLACHSSLAPEGVNAVEYAAELISEIRRRGAQIAAGKHDKMYDVPYTTLLTTVVNGGGALNIVPERCVVKFEARGMGVNEAKAVTEEVMAWARAELEPAMKQKDPNCGIDFEEILEYPALEMQPDHSVVTLAKQLVDRNSHGKVSFGTEAGLFVSLTDVPTVVVGPGAIAQAHKPDEFIAVSELVSCADFIERLTAHCSQGGIAA